MFGKNIKFINVNKGRIHSFLIFIIPYLGRLKEADLIVEIGCDSGFLASEVYKAHKNIHLIDLIDNRKHCNYLSFHSTNMADEKLPFEDGTVSIIIATQVIEHIENLTFFINECHRLLKKDGRLIISYPNYSNLMQRIVFLLKGTVLRLGGQVSSGGHINFLPLKSFKSWISNKFSLEKVEGDFMASTNYLPRLINWLRKKKDEENRVVFPTI